MIHKIYSDLESFRGLQLEPGLNILLADKSKGASLKQTRNSVGKTSLIELVHFVLGANAGKSSLFRSKPLVPWAFGVELDIGRDRVAIERSGSDHPKVVVSAGEVSSWPIQPVRNKTTGNLTIQTSKWKSVLGNLVFGLPVDRASVYGRFSPTFRSLFSYFVRRQDSEGFTKEICYSSKQQIWDSQVAISFLLGFDWSVSQKFQELREQEKDIRQLKKVSKNETLPGLPRSSASLRTEVALAEAKARKLRRELDEFNVVPEYKSIEREATKLTRSMNRLANENTADRQLLDQLTKATENERTPEVGKLETMHQEAGVVFPKLVAHRLDQAAAFHRAIVSNRKAHLRSEIVRGKARVARRDREKSVMGKRRADLMVILRSGGALSQYTLMQEEYSRQSTRAEALKQELAMAEKLDSETTKAEIERRQLKERLHQDFIERQAVFDEAIVLFGEISRALYERDRAGRLTIGASENGPTFDVRIDAKKSHGITNMQIFCFDMMLAVISARRGHSPGFLVHDSHLFDGVDERQVAKAIQIGRQFAEECGFQYIVTMNSDALPRDGFDAGFNVNQYINSQRLDDSPHGGLFGFRFR